MSLLVSLSSVLAVLADLFDFVLAAAADEPAGLADSLLLSLLAEA